MHSQNRVPILVIEDNEVHWKQIEEVLSNGLYAPQHLANGEHLAMQNYLAIYPSTKIIIVDLELDKSINKGWQIIENHLWKSNRTAFFLVFSKHKDEELKIKPREPHANMTFLWKGVGDGIISEEALVKLVKMIDIYCAYSSPELPVPRYDAYRILNEDSNLWKWLPADASKSRIAFDDPVSESVNRLNFACDVARFFDRGGMLTKQIGIGVFGSCGRMEARPDSDLEIMVIFEERFDNDTEVCDMACVFWNRMHLAITSEGRYVFEGFDWVEADPSRLLEYRVVDDRTEDFHKISNEIIPVINEKMFERGQKKSMENVRNKAFQILTEMRPIFNEAYIHQMKLRILQQLCAADKLPPVSALIRHKSFSAIFRQFDISTATPVM